MKIILTCIVLLSGLQYAYADATLSFSDVIKDSANTSRIYKIKNQQLKILVPGQDSVNLYNAATEEFISQQTPSGKRVILNKQRLQQRVNQLNIERLNALTEVEKNLQKNLGRMTSTQQETAEILLNTYRYPEFYGEHTSLIVKLTNRSNKVNGIECRQYHLYKMADLLKTFCFAEPDSLKISNQDYKTLRSYYAFNYAMQSQILIAMGDTKFALISYDQHSMPGVLIEEISYPKSAAGAAKISSHSVLKKINTQAMQSADFLLKSTP